MDMIAFTDSGVIVRITPLTSRARGTGVPRSDVLPDQPRDCWAKLRSDGALALGASYRSGAGEGWSSAAPLVRVPPRLSLATTKLPAAIGLAPVVCRFREAFAACIVRAEHSCMNLRGVKKHTGGMV